MIARIEGRIIEVGEASILLRSSGGGLTFEVLIPSADVYRWQEAMGQTVELHTLPFFEAPGQGTTFIPRLVGFATEADREFFLLFTRTRGIGYRKALRAMVAPAGQIATAIAGRDIGWLKTLPEVGKRTAETIVAELHSRMSDFLLRSGEELSGRSPAPATPAGAESAEEAAANEVEVRPARGRSASGKGGRAGATAKRGRPVVAPSGGPVGAAPAPVAEAGTSSAAAGDGGSGGGGALAGAGRRGAASARYTDARDAVVALVRMGESRPVAQGLMDRVLTEFPDATGVEELITVALRLRTQS